MSLGISKSSEEFRQRGREYQKQWRLKNPDKCAKYRRTKKMRHPGMNAVYSANWRLANPEKSKLIQRKWARANRDKINAWAREKEATDPSYRILRRLRTRMICALHKQSTGKQASTESLVGCSALDLLKHLEAKFRDEMSWNNYGKLWEVDHIIPCSSYDLTVQKNCEECFHYSNLQPLLVHENRKKNNLLLGLSGNAFIVR